MSATKKTAKSTRTTRRATTRKATTRKATTRKAATARRTTTSRRRTARRTTTRRAQPKIATTIGAGLATLAVAAFAGASWPVRIALVVAALVLVGGYLLVQGRRHDAAEAASTSAQVAAVPEAEAEVPEPEPAAQPPATPHTHAAPQPDAAQPAETRPEDTA